MKIAFSLGWYFPTECGGSEVYVDALARTLTAQGAQCVIAAPSKDDKEKSYVWNGIPVYRFPIKSKDLTLEEIRGDVPPSGLDRFAAWLKEQKPDIYHQHSCTYGCDHFNLRIAKSLGCKVVETVHVPGLICCRGTMMLFGENACDGKIDLSRCASCWGHDRGIPEAASNIIANVPMMISEKFGKYNLKMKNATIFSRFSTAMARRALVEIRHQRVLEHFSLNDRMIAVCQWLYDALLINGISKEKLFLSFHGLLGSPRDKEKNLSRDSDTLKLAFFGRWTKVKAVELIALATIAVPQNIEVQLTIFGILQTKEDELYRKYVLNIIKGNPRVQIKEPVPHEKIQETMQQFDLIAVPSLWLETGPYVVLEAQAAGVPVIGSRLGGIAEHVTHGINGWLVDIGSVKKWKEAVCFLAKNPSFVRKLKSLDTKVRSVEDVASEMMVLYKELID